MLAWLGALAAAAAASPHAAVPIETTGIVQAELATGRIQGNICVANRPTAGATSFVLNAGLNVARVTDGDGKPVEFKGWYKPGIDGEARVYKIAGSAPAKLCVSYVGAMPVYPAHDAPDDFKGVIAFNGDSVRAADQAAWLPIAFDDDAKRRFAETAYDLEVRCTGCRFLYMSGAAPVEQPRAHFASAVPRLPLLFGGTGPLTRTPSVTFINETVPEAEAKELTELFARIGAFYASYLGRPLGDTPTLLRMITVDQSERDRTHRSWGFATWPIIALSGSIADLAKTILIPDERHKRGVPYLAHEAAHYYFGTINDTAGPYHWLLLESAAEYMSLKATAAIKDPTVVEERRQVLIGQAKDETSYMPLDAITDADQIGGSYRYAYAPLLLLALERQVGDKAMRGFMRALLVAPAPRDWQDLRSIAIRGGIDGAEWDAWRSRCVSGGTLDCAVDNSAL